LEGDFDRKEKKKIGKEERDDVRIKKENIKNEGEFEGKKR
jgi:hypothetical protein